MLRRTFLTALVLGALPLPALAADPPKEIGIGYSSIVPSSLILKEKGWLDAELCTRGIAVKWVQPLGSNKTIEFLRAKSIDFGPANIPL